MSKLEQLIAELCPDDVVYKPLATISNYSSSRIDAKYVNSSSYVGVDNLLPDKKGKTNSSYVPTEGRLIQFLEGDILIGNIRPYLKKIWLATHDGGTNGDVLVIQIKDRKTLYSEYLFYVLSSDQFFNYDVQNSKGAKMPRGGKAAVMKYHIPLPPLPVQREIVRILDNFTELTLELTTQLSAELEARRKQYEYYRDLLLAMDGKTDVKWMTIGEIASYRRGSFPQPYGDSRWYGGINAMPFVQVADVADSGMRLNATTKQQISELAMPKSTYVPKGTVIVSLQGSIGKVAITQYDSYVDRTLAIFEQYKIDINKRYFAYQIERKFCIEKDLARGSTIKTITKEEFTKFEIPIPSTKEQERIVFILDRFEALYNDLTSGLHAEIEARQKQYEYYRDKLLSFKEVTA